GSQTFLYLTPGTSGYSFTETAPAGWAGNTTNVGCAISVAGAGGTAIDTTNATTGVVLNPGTVVSPTINTIGAGATVTCTFTNSTLPTLTVVKNVRSTLSSVIFYFGLDGVDPGNYFPPSGVSITANGGLGQGSYGPAVIGLGSHTLTEILTAPSTQGFTLTDISCNGGSNVSINLPDGSASFNVNYGDNVTCSFVNSNVGTTRTQGFWATHTKISNAVWNGLPLPVKSSIQLFPPVIGSPDAYLCGVLITAIDQTEDNWLMGGFYSKPSQTAKGGKRSNIDHDRIQMLQQYLAAVLNNHLFGSSPPGGLSLYRSDYCGGNAAAIQHDIGILDTFNTLGDTGAFTPGAS